MPLIWRVLLGNAVVVTTGALVLAITPITVSSPVAAEQAAVLIVGGLLMVVIDYLLLRQSFRPLHELTRAMREVDLLRPGARLAIATSDPQVQAVTQSFNEMVRRLEDERQLSARRAIAAQEAERLRVSRELHDEVGQLLTGVLLRLASVEQRSPEAMRPELSDAREELRRTMNEVREIAQQLRPPVLEELGLVSALAALATDVAHRSGITIERDLDRSIEALPDAVEVVAYRVAQESLTNVVRHAASDAATLRLAADGDGAIVLEIGDRGTGFRVPATPSTSGLAGMRERALLVGGELDVSSAPGAGTTVRLRLPTAATRARAA